MRCRLTPPQKVITSGSFERLEGLISLSNGDNSDHKSFKRCALRRYKKIYCESAILLYNDRSDEVRKFDTICLKTIKDCDLSADAVKALKSYASLALGPTINTKVKATHRSEPTDGTKGVFAYPNRRW